jgi:hypothetical protein
MSLLKKIKKILFSPPENAWEYGHVLAELCRTLANISLGISTSALVGLLFFYADPQTKIFSPLDFEFLMFLICVYPFLGLLSNYFARRAEIRFFNWQRQKAATENNASKKISLETLNDASEKVNLEALLPVAKEIFLSTIGSNGLEKFNGTIVEDGLKAREKRIAQITDDFAKFVHLLQKKLEDIQEVSL